MAIIGIDLGTSNSAAAVLRGGRPLFIPSAEGVGIGSKAFPCYVAVTAEGQLLVGELARRQATENPDGTSFAFKRRMGKRENIRLRDRNYSPEQLSAFLLQKIKRDAETFLGEPVSQAVVSVPANFDDNQRTATKDACRIAGLEVLRLLNEPSAAALAYGFERQAQKLRIAVIDLGGGAFDVTILEFGKGVYEVKATNGDTRLGGSDMSQRVFDHLAERFQMATNIDVHHDRKAVARLLEAAEAAKIELTHSLSTRIELPSLLTVNGEPRHLALDFNRTQLERLVRPVIERCRVPVDRALHDAGITTREVDRLLFVGGPTRMLLVRSYFEKLFVRKAEIGVDPMGCVAAGAAIQAGVLAGEVGNGSAGSIMLVDVTPLTLGVETMGGIATPLIARNTPLPVKKSEIFTTASDLQASITIDLFQGERPMAGDNASLGEFSLNSLSPAPHGEPKIEVTFAIDSNGILGVSAKDLPSGKLHPIRISASPRLSEIDKKLMIEEAERCAEIDIKRREDSEKLNAADTVCGEAEKMLANSADKLGNDLKKQIDSALQATRVALLQKEIKTASEQVEGLKRVLQEAAAAIYNQASQALRATGGEYPEHEPQPNVEVSTGEARPSGSGPRGKVVDAGHQETHGYQENKELKSVRHTG